MDLAEEPSVPAAFPLLVLTPPPGSNRSSYEAFSLPDQKLHDVTPLVPSKKACLPTPQGWVLVLSSSNPNFSSDDGGTYLLNAEDGSRIELPALRDDEAPGTCRCVLSNAAAAPGCGVLVFDLASPVMWFCRVGRDPRWSRHGYDIRCFDLPEDYCSPPTRRNFFDVVGVNGRFFFCESVGNGPVRCNVDEYFPSRRHTCTIRPFDVF